MILNSIIWVVGFSADVETLHATSLQGIPPPSNTPIKHHRYTPPLYTPINPPTKHPRRNYPISTLIVKFVLFPFCRIIFYVIIDALKCAIIANDIIIKTRLPFKFPF
jgi:hypothetical protein